MSLPNALDFRVKQNLRQEVSCGGFIRWRRRAWWKRVDSDHRSKDATDLQSAPFGHSGTLPHYKFPLPETCLPYGRTFISNAMTHIDINYLCRQNRHHTLRINPVSFCNTKAVSPKCVCDWSWWTDSNPRPADYKSAALPAELHQRNTTTRECLIIISQRTSFVKCFLKIF